MPSKDTSVSPTDNERQLLRFLCAQDQDVVQRRNLFQRLSQYPWRDREHQILCEAIGELLATAPYDILNALPAALTRCGFPDISCEALAESPCINAAAAFALAEGLLRASQ